ncbi:MAG: ubiquitin-like protein [Candidatus Helarchaeota archaeon]
MDSIQSIKVKFKLETQLIEEEISQSWTIGKIKGKIRKKFKINPYYTLQLIYNGQVLENKQKFKEINYKIGSIIKVLASKTSEV